jgi:photosynthetic reaction center H subunit
VSDGEQGATVTDLWVDRSEPQRALPRESMPADHGDEEGRRVLIPMTFARVKQQRRRAREVRLRRHFADAPSTANPDQITLQEEDKIGAYYGGGYLYALPERTEPLL